jgi:hypothetical protein
VGDENRHDGGEKQHDEHREGEAVDADANHTESGDNGYNGDTAPEPRVNEFRPSGVVALQEPTCPPIDAAFSAASHARLRSCGRIARDGDNGERPVRTGDQSVQPVGYRYPSTAGTYNTQCSGPTTTGAESNDCGRAELTP